MTDTALYVLYRGDEVREGDVMTDYLDGMVTAFACGLPTEPRKAQRVKLLEEAADYARGGLS